MPLMKRHLPAILLLTLAWALLAGARFGATWAGVKTYPQAEAAVLASDGDARVDAAGRERALVPGERLRRGEIVRVGAGGYAELSVAGVRVGLDERTDLLLDGLDAAHPSVRLAQGRLAAVSAGGSSPLSVTTEATDAVLMPGNAITVINYSFRHEVEVVPVGGAVGIVFSQDDAVVVTGPQRVTERPEVSVEPFSFDMASSAGAAFYARFGLPPTR